MEKTLWKKNLDSKYISGEDLQLSNKGLSPEMVVSIAKFNDDKTFDKNKQADVTVSALYLVNESNKPLYKPVILNKTNAKFFIKLTGSDYIDDWLNVKVKMFAQKDSRHGYVVRFKQHFLPILQPNTPEFDKAKLAIEKSGFTVEQVRSKYQVSKDVELLLTTKKD